jgi:hypothetical protein
MEGEASGTCPCLLNKGYPLGYADRDRRPPPHIYGVGKQRGSVTAWKADGAARHRCRIPDTPPIFGIT